MTDQKEPEQMPDAWAFDATNPEKHSDEPDTIAQPVDYDKIRDNSYQSNMNHKNDENI